MLPKHWVLLLFLFPACGWGDGGLAPPADPGKAAGIEIRFIYNSYMHLLQREPDSAEMLEGQKLFAKNGFRRETKAEFLDGFFRDPEYILVLIKTARTDFLENVGAPVLSRKAQDLNQLLKNEEMRVFFGQYRKDLDNLYRLAFLETDPEQNLYRINLLHRYIVDNPIYAEINMGIDNFVLSCFQNFLARYPTRYELAQAKTMIEGNPGILFLQTGNSGTDFLDIFFSSTEYREGQVRYWYKKYRYAEPDPAKIRSFCTLIPENGDIRPLQKEILLEDNL